MVKGGHGAGNAPSDSFGLARVAAAPAVQSGV